MESGTKNKLSDRKFLLKWVIPVFLVLAIYIIQLFPAWIEKNYSTHWYVFISRLLRSLTGWLPFSIGDLFYIITGIRLLFWLIGLVWVFVKKRFTWKRLGLGVLGVIRLFLWIYIWFNLAWGLNYNRLGIAYQLHLKTEEYSTQELSELVCDLIDTLNTTRDALGDSTYQYPPEKASLLAAHDAYEKAEEKFPFLEYRRYSVKPSLMTAVVSYAGYSGYYNPFSGEAQVNTDLPGFLIPYITCHEMGHQLGYASESEASFVGYLAATNSGNTFFRYSAAFDLYLTASGELYRRDFWAARAIATSLNPVVRKDVRAYREYIFGKQNHVEPVVKLLYDQYLKANQQTSGINSYNEVVGWLIAYRKKNPLR